MHTTRTGISEPHPRSSLLSYLERMLRIPGKVVFIIDALDEHPTPPDELLGLLASLNHRLHLRLLVTIRDEPDIRTAMKGIGAIEFDLGKAPEQKELPQIYH
jgi:hypothetical protein